jgi:hypothetical protein
VDEDKRSSIEITRVVVTISKEPRPLKDLLTKETSRRRNEKLFFSSYNSLQIIQTMSLSVFREEEDV